MRASLAALVVTTLIAASHAAAVGSYIPEGPVYSPDGTHIAWYDQGTWRVWLAHSNGDSAHPVGKPFDTIGQIAWTQSGIVVDANSVYYRLLLDGTRVRLGDALDYGFSVGGSRIASGSPACPNCIGPVEVRDLADGRTWTLGDPSTWNVGPALSPNGSRVAYAQPHGVVVAIVGGRQIRMIPKATCPAWAPNGRSISYADRGGTWIVPVAGGAPRRVLRMPLVCASDWSPDARSIAFVTYAGRLAIVNVSTRAVRLAPVSLRGAAFAWSPDSRTLVVAATQAGCRGLVSLDARTLHATPLRYRCP